MPTIHIPVLLKETIEVLIEGTGKTFIDCTVGTGGHALELLAQTPESVDLIGLDKDEESLKMAKERLQAFEKRIKLLKGGYENLKEILASIPHGPIAGFLFDLGMSSYQLDEPQRGFSFRNDGPLDMRFDVSQKLTAEELINSATQEQLLTLFKRLGEEKWSRRLSRVIVERRDKKHFHSTVELSDFIRRNIPRRAAHKTLARVFQALRISVNNELENLKSGLSQAFELLNIDGRIAVISYHSLEDRIAKNFFRGLKKQDLLVVINPRCARPSKSERMKNRRSRSARLRVIRKTADVTEEVMEKVMENLETILEADEENGD
ncbi:MAG: 16S rRNA (cytosine(1402)-N(4))-methyltransferase [Candidatus Cloacimonas sp. 4484_209]|nr:MAG: 16S rRNA (cytosine(1402)-N(4))-methyltransferase [Candidatus Cloacimonas sp. 4484_209]